MFFHVIPLPYQPDTHPLDPSTAPHTPAIPILGTAAIWKTKCYSSISEILARLDANFHSMASGHYEDRAEVPF